MIICLILILFSCFYFDYIKDSASAAVRVGGEENNNENLVTITDLEILSEHFHDLDLLLPQREVPAIIFYDFWG